MDMCFIMHKEAGGYKVCSKLQKPSMAVGLGPHRYKGLCCPLETSWVSPIYNGAF